MKCPNCGTELPESAKFCLECAAPLAARCARTGGWWKESRSYSLVSGHCEYRD